MTIKLLPSEITIADSTWVLKEDNEIVLDPYLGSGSTLIACEQTNRICYGMEIDASYISVILDRWSNYTGKDPIRVSDGKKWSKIKEE